MNEIKILSIDLDIIMHACLRLYNEEANGGLNPTQFWQRLNDNKNIKDFIYYDAKVYNQLFQLVIKNIYLKNSPIFFIQSHEKIIDLLKENNLYNDYQIDLLNIDFHHDLMYSKEQLQLIHDFDQYSCADWVGYLFLKNKIKNYTWLTAANAQDCFLLEELPSLKETITINKQYLYSLPEVIPNYDYIFVCLSPQWVPFECEHLYNLLKDISNIVYEENKND